MGHLEPDLFAQLDKQSIPYGAYPDSVSVTRPGQGGTQDPITGVYTPAQEQQVLTSEADVQDDRFEYQTNPEGDVAVVAGAKVYVPLRVNLSTLVTGDRVLIEQTMGDGFLSRIGEVLEVQIFNQMILVKWL